MSTPKFKVGDLVVVRGRPQEFFTVKGYKIHSGQSFSSIIYELGNGNNELDSSTAPEESMEYLDKSQRVTANRYNQGKPELSRIPRAALDEIAQVLMYGASKYPDDPDGTPNYKKYWGDDTIRVCLNSALRHAYAMAEGEMVDIESGRSHAAHAAVNFMFILDYMRSKV